DLRGRPGTWAASLRVRCPLARVAARIARSRANAGRRSRRAGLLGWRLMIRPVRLALPALAVLTLLSACSDDSAGTATLSGTSTGTDSSTTDPSTTDPTT